MGGKEDHLSETHTHKQGLENAQMQPAIDTNDDYQLASQARSQNGYHLDISE